MAAALWVSALRRWQSMPPQEVASWSAPELTAQFAGHSSTVLLGPLTACEMGGCSQLSPSGIFQGYMRCRKVEVFWISEHAG